MNYVDYDVDYGDDCDQISAKEHLRFELGWSEVRRGLGLILRGYFLLIGGAALLGIIAAIVLSMSPQERIKIPWQVREIGPFLGLALLGLLSLYCYGCILVGHWRCLLNAPERRGARWLMFGCITCVLAGPALNLASNLTGVEHKPHLERGLDGIKELKMTKEGTIMQVASGAVQVVGSILFILFLRAVANCFEEHGGVVFVDIYLVFSVILLVGTIWLVVSIRDVELLLKYALVMGLAWFVNFLTYLAVVIVVRGSITRGLARLTPPLKNPSLQTALTRRSPLTLN